MTDDAPTARARPAAAAALAAAAFVILLVGWRLTSGAALVAITSPLGVMTALAAICAFYFWLEQASRWKIFDFLPPLLWIYATPIVLSNSGVLPFSSEAYAGLRAYGLPLFIALMLLKVDVAGAVRIMGKGVFVMLIGSAGVVVGGVTAYALGTWTGLVDPSAWPAFGTLSGSWIGGTGNMNAAWAALEGQPEHMTMAAIADNLVYIVWLPLLLGSRAFADRFNRWARVPEDRVRRMEQAALAGVETERPPSMQQILYLALIALTTTWVSVLLAAVLPVVEIGGQAVITESTWVILLVTSISLLLSTTRARELPGAQPIAMAIIYIFVASIGARANLADTSLGEIGGFVAAAYVWIAIHGAFVLAGAKLFRVDVHTLAIASAANVGGAASAPVVAAHHRQSLVPASILMALIGYAVGNYLAILTGRLCQLIGT
ncbi:MAG: DUF819 family protein [Wenzhouxiangellaceae bacterium]|nr:DUF819 family protein [Wenzhouxiangellaceae bacterium]